jgi:hypothetical protein
VTYVNKGIEILIVPDRDVVDERREGVKGVRGHDRAVNTGVEVEREVVGGSKVQTVARSNSGLLIYYTSNPRFVRRAPRRRGSLIKKGNQAAKKRPRAWMIWVRFYEKSGVRNVPDTKSVVDPS